MSSYVQENKLFSYDAILTLKLHINGGLRLWKSSYIFCLTPFEMYKKFILQF